MSAATALKLLQQFAAEGRAITEDADNIIFGDQGAFPKTLATGLKTTAKREGYELHALVFFQQQHAAAHTGDEKPKAADTPEAKRQFMNGYLTKCAGQNVAAVQFSDYDVVVDFLAGKHGSASWAAGQDLVGMETGDIDALKALQARLIDHPKQATAIEAIKQETTRINRQTAMSAPGVNFLEYYQRLDDGINREWQEKLKRKTRDERGTKEHGLPIIIVPAAANSIITLHNAKSVLQDARFVSSAQAKRDAAAAGKKQGRPATKLGVKHTFANGQTLAFEIFNSYVSVPVFRRHDVVCVFVHGPEWQFKGWPFPSLSQIFTKHQCFHLKFKGERVHPNVAKWTTVSPLEIGKTNRATDHATIYAFWVQLEMHMRIKCSEFFDSKAAAVLKGSASADTVAASSADGDAAQATTSATDGGGAGAAAEQDAAPSGGDRKRSRT